MNNKEFIKNTVNKIYDFAIKNDFKKEINRNLPKQEWSGKLWQILLLQNQIPYSDKKPLDICLESNDFSQDEKELICAIKDGLIGSFEILNHENDLHLYNFVNEKEYTAEFVSSQPFNFSKNKYFSSMLIKFKNSCYILDPVKGTNERIAALLTAKEILETDAV